MNTRPVAIILASGGLDSCVAAAMAQKEYDLAFCHANYGQRTVERELRAFRAQAAFFGVGHILEADLSFLGRIGGSSLTDSSLAVPTEAEESAEIPTTYVPFRNSLFLATATSWAEVLGAHAIFIGANVLDNPGYPDCRPEYFDAFSRVIALGTRPDSHIEIKAPLIYLDKAGIVRLGLELAAPLSLTWSCYVNDDQACGRCSSCVLRLKGFAANGVPDPIPYR
jgi:7-cyano-7-deazaguanine synthase